MPSHPHSRRRSQPQVRLVRRGDAREPARQRRASRPRAAVAASKLPAPPSLLCFLLPVILLLLACCSFCFFRVLRPGGCPVPAAGTGTGEICPPVRGWGRGTFCFLCCGDGYGVHKPDGGSPVAIPNLPPVPPYHSHSQIRLFLRTFFCILRFILFRFDLFFHGCFVVLLCKRCDGSDDLICLDCEECESYLAAKLRRGSN
uniref:Uncharacterized protein n=1 Tax=Oryza nivara TaxID=4536 RepID=A0A0E0GAH5_ORYNI